MIKGVTMFVRTDKDLEDAVLHERHLRQQVFVGLL